MKKRIMYIQGKRAGIKEDSEKDGIIEVRPGIAGIDLGDKQYAMAYIRVLDENHCFKGMCLYSDNLPDGYDIICYYSDPYHGLKALRTVTPEMGLGKEIMTKIPIDNELLKAITSPRPDPHLAYEFLNDRMINATKVKKG